MFVLKNGHAPQLSGANCHAKLSHSKQLLKNIHLVILAQFWLTDKKIFAVVTPKTQRISLPTLRNCSNQEERRHDKTLAHTISVQTVTDGISRRVTSGRENTFDTCQIVNHAVKVI